jgi:hypothetical protein
VLDYIAEPDDGAVGDLSTVHINERLLAALVNRTWRWLINCQETARSSPCWAPILVPYTSKMHAKLPTVEAMWKPHEKQWPTKQSLPR